SCMSEAAVSLARGLDMRIGLNQTCRGRSAVTAGFRAKSHFASVFLSLSASLQCPQCSQNVGAGYLSTVMNRRKTKLIFMSALLLFESSRVIKAYDRPWTNAYAQTLYRTPVRTVADGKQREKHASLFGNTRRRGSKRDL